MICQILNNSKSCHINLPLNTNHNIIAYVSAHICISSTSHVSFDSDAVEAVLDSGCSTTLTSERSDFITYSISSGEVEGLGKHNIVGTGTVRYDVIDDDGNKVSIIINDAIHVPTLEIRLISIQQIAQQSNDPLAGCHILANNLTLQWDGHTKTIPYNKTSNLPILYTVPGGKRAAAYISQHMMTYAYKMNISHPDKSNKLIRPENHDVPPEELAKLTNKKVRFKLDENDSTNKIEQLTSVSVCQKVHTTSTSRSRTRAPYKTMPKMPHISGSVQRSKIVTPLS